jgi:hypothetical protein
MTRPAQNPFAAFLLLLPLALLPLPLLAQTEEPPVPPETSAAPSQPSDIREEIDKIKASIEKASGGLAISGFFDARGSDRRIDPGIFSMGDFELDLAKEIGKSLQIGAAIVLNDEGASLAVGFIDFHLFGGLVAPRGRLPVEKGFHIQLGRFDVPFGNDWQYFASKDRTELTAPLTTDAIMDGGYNDVGFRILGNTGSLSYSAFVLRGTGAGNLYGGRLGFAPFDQPYRLKPRTRVITVGVSLLHDVGEGGETQQTALALDSEAQLGGLHLRAEYLKKDTRIDEGQDGRLRRWGWHATAAYRAGDAASIPLVPYARFDTVTNDADGGVSSGSQRTERLTLGFNANFLSVVTLKVEYQRNIAAPAEVEAQEGSGRDAWFGQVVVVF